MGDIIIFLSNVFNKFKSFIKNYFPLFSVILSGIAFAFIYNFYLSYYNNIPTISVVDSQNMLNVLNNSKISMNRSSFSPFINCNAYGEITNVKLDKLNAWVKESNFNNFKNNCYILREEHFSIEEKIQDNITNHDINLSKFYRKSIIVLSSLSLVLITLFHYSKVF